MFPSTWRWVSYTRVVITIFPGTETRWAAFWGPDESTEYQDSSDINCGTKGFLVQKNCHYLFHCLAVWQYLGLFPPKKMIRKFIISMYSWQVSFGDCRVPFFNIRDPVTVVVWNALDKRFLHAEIGPQDFFHQQYHLLLEPVNILHFVAWTLHGLKCPKTNQQPNYGTSWVAVWRLRSSNLR